MPSNLDKRKLGFSYSSLERSVGIAAIVSGQLY